MSAALAAFLHALNHASEKPPTSRSCSKVVYVRMPLPVSTYAKTLTLLSAQTLSTYHPTSWFIQAPMPTRSEQRFEKHPQFKINDLG